MGELSAAVLLDRLIDYAGIFPPARLPLPEALDEFHRLREGAAAWLVGPCMVKASDLPALGEIVESRTGPPLPIGVILDGTGLAADLERLAARPAGTELVQLEVAVGDGVDPDASVAALRAGRAWTEPIVLYLEAAGTAPLPRQVETLACWSKPLAETAEVRLKIRTGGLSADAVPAPETVAGFLLACLARGLSCKASAGLHQPYRHFDEATGGVQYGFVNLLAAASLAAGGAGGASELVEALEATDAAALSLLWQKVGSGAPAAATRRLLRSFGSCSVAEPVEGLAALGVLSPEGALVEERLW
jgi:hypothetical protein